jgi:MerR family mercuric resistance operon transcriptional regulator
MAPFTIGTLSRDTGCHIETIRYYERIGLLPAPPRSAGGHRLYDARHADRLSFIRRSRALGFPLEEVRTLMDAVDSGAYSCAEVRALTLRQLADVRHKIAELRKLEKALKQMARECDGGDRLPCPIVNALRQ